VIISEKGKFIFVHVQKTAGKTIEGVLKENYSDANYWHGRHGHVINGIKEIGREKWDEYFKFAFVRNPWDRLVSWYAAIQDNLKKLPSDKQISNEPFGSPFWNHAVRDSHDFESFLFNCTDIVFDNGCFKSYSFNQIDYLSDENGNISVDFIGRFEGLSNDASKIFERLGIEVGKLPNINPSQHDHYSHYYTQKTRDLIAQRFQRDIEMFNYQFE